MRSERVQRLDHAGALQRRLSTRPDQLVHLRHELDFADSARPEFDVVAHGAAAAFGVDATLHLAQRLNRAEVEVTAEHERFQVVDEPPPRGHVAGTSARPYPGITFPVTTLFFVVALDRIEVQHQRTAVAVGPQAHVDPEDKPVDGDRVEHADELLPESQEELLIRA